MDSRIMVDGAIDPDIPSTSQVDNIEVINVNKNNLTVLWPEILVDLAGCDYLAIDLELSGLGNLSGARNRDVEKRYSALREAACSRSVLSLGIAFFSSKGKNIGSRCLDYSCKAYNILTLCSQSFTIEPDALKFLAKHSFDFNRLISEGVPYSVSTAKGACPLRSLITEIFCSQKTLLLHNGLVDVLFLYHHFYSPLPESWGTLLNALSDLFTAESPLCDSKYLTEFEYRSPATFLEYVFRKSQRDNHREAGEGRYHLGISFPSTSHVSFSEKVICSLPANFPYHAVPANLAELVCSSFANHGYCGQHSKGICPKSHDVDLSLDLEYLKREKERLKKKRKYDYLKPETILKKEREQLEAKALKIVENLAAPSEPRIAITGCHRAGVDAFMTGFTVLYNERVNLWRTGKLDPLHLNKIPLSGKDRPLQLQPTHSAGNCPLHEERFAQIQSRREKIKN